MPGLANPESCQLAFAESAIDPTHPCICPFGHKYGGRTSNHDYSLTAFRFPTVRTMGLLESVPVSMLRAISVLS